jgi:hypothetical protein
MGLVPLIASAVYFFAFGCPGTAGLEPWKLFPEVNVNFTAQNANIKGKVALPPMGAGKNAGGPREVAVSSFRGTFIPPLPCNCLPSAPLSFSCVCRGWAPRVVRSSEPSRSLQHRQAQPLAVSEYSLKGQRARDARPLPCQDLRPGS